MGARFSVYEAKTHLSEILRMVKRRRGVIITDRGKDVAQVLPIPEAKSLEDRLASLEAAGIITPRAAPRIAFGQPVRRPGGLRRFLAERNRM